VSAASSQVRQRCRAPGPTPIRIRRPPCRDNTRPWAPTRAQNKGTITLGRRGLFGMPGEAAVPARGLLTLQKRSTRRFDRRSVTKDPTRRYSPTTSSTPGLEGRHEDHLPGGPNRRRPLSAPPGRPCRAAACAQGELGTRALQLATPSGNIDFQAQPAITMMAVKTGQGTSWTRTVPTRRTAPRGVQGQRAPAGQHRHRRESLRTPTRSFQTSTSSTPARIDARTDPNDPNVYNVATNFRRALIRRHITTI